MNEEGREREGDVGDWRGRDWDGVVEEEGVSEWDSPGERRAKIGEGGLESSGLRMGMGC